LYGTGLPPVRVPAERLTMLGGNAFFTHAERREFADLEGYCPPDEEPEPNAWERFFDRIDAMRGRRMFAALAERARGEEGES